MNLQNYTFKFLKNINTLFDLHLNSVWDHQTTVSKEEESEEWL